MLGAVSFRQYKTATGLWLWTTSILLGLRQLLWDLKEELCFWPSADVTTLVPGGNARRRKVSFVWQLPGCWSLLLKTPASPGVCVLGQSHNPGMGRYGRFSRKNSFFPDGETKAWSTRCIHRVCPIPRFLIFNLTSSLGLAPSQSLLTESETSFSQVSSGEAGKRIWNLRRFLSVLHLFL